MYSNQEHPLTPENFETHFLIDSEQMASVTKDPAGQNQFLAFVLDHQTGETVHAQIFQSLEPALNFLNRMPRKWTLDTASGCGESLCGGTQCKGSACKVKHSETFCPKHPENRSTNPS